MYDFLGMEVFVITAAPATAGHKYHKGEVMTSLYLGCLYASG